MKEGQARIEAKIEAQMNEIKALLMGKNSKSKEKGAEQLQ